MNTMRYAFRSLIKTPAFTVVALLALALGIGANTAIFSVVDALLLRPLPYDHADRLAFIWERRINREAISVSYPDFLDWQKQAHSFQSIAARRGNSYNLLGFDEPEQVEGSEITSELFPLLGIRPLLGRSFSAEEDRPGAPRVVVIAYSLWQRKFSGDRAVLGKEINLDGESFTIIGVMPAGFRYPYSHLKGEIYTSLGREADTMAERGAHPGIYAVARLKPGVPMEDARADLRNVAESIAKQYPASNRIITAEMDGLQDRMMRGIRPALLVLLGAVGFVLLIACANVANLLLAKAAGRRQEIAIRVALGAARHHLIRQLLTESVMLAVAGAALGLLFASAGLRGLAMIVPPDTPRAAEIALNARALVFTMLIALGTGVLFGLIPALETTRRDVQDGLKEGSRRSSGSSRQPRVRAVLVVAQMALSLVLLIGAGLMLSSFLRLVNTSPGIQPANVMALQMSLPGAKYSRPELRAGFYRQLLDRTAILPGVRSVGLVSPLPLGGNGSQQGFAPEGKVVNGPQDVTTGDTVIVSPGYFQTMGVPLMKGRTFTERDGADAPLVCMVDETLAKIHFPDGAVGRRLVIGAGHGHSRLLEIVGVVGHVKSYGVDQPSRVEIYLPYAQVRNFSMTLVVKKEKPASAIVPAIRVAVRRIDPNQPISNVLTMEQVLADTTAQQRLSMILLAVFAATALLLAAVGLYGVVSYSVTQRMHEFGIRLALGARGDDIVAMVLKEAGRLAVVGVVIGLAAAFGLTRLMSSLLFGVGAADPLTFTMVPLVLAVVALAASYIPARRATRVSAVDALRCD
jgi:predicted permease